MLLSKLYYEHHMVEYFEIIKGEYPTVYTPQKGLIPSNTYPVVIMKHVCITGPEKSESHVKRMDLSFYQLPGLKIHRCDALECIFGDVPEVIGGSVSFSVIPPRSCDPAWVIKSKLASQQH